MLWRGLTWWIIHDTHMILSVLCTELCIIHTQYTYNDDTQYSTYAMIDNTDTTADNTDSEWWIIENNLSPLAPSPPCHIIIVIPVGIKSFFIFILIETIIPPLCWKIPLHPSFLVLLILFYRGEFKVSPLILLLLLLGCAARDCAWQPRCRWEQ